MYSPKKWEKMRKNLKNLCCGFGKKNFGSDTDTVFGFGSLKLNFGLTLIHNSITGNAILLMNMYILCMLHVSILNYTLFDCIVHRYNLRKIH